MAKYKVIGEHVVDGVAPGGTTDLEDLTDEQIQALIDSGNVETAKGGAAAAKPSEKVDVVDKADKAD